MININSDNFRSLNQKITDGYSIAIISAYNDDRNQEENIRNTKLVAANITKIGLGHFFIEGHWNTYPEIKEDLIVVCAKLDDRNKFINDVKQVCFQFLIPCALIRKEDHFILYNFNKNESLDIGNKYSVNLLDTSISHLRDVEFPFSFLRERHEVGFIGRLKPQK